MSGRDDCEIKKATRVLWYAGKKMVYSVFIVNFGCIKQVVWI